MREKLRRYTLMMRVVGIIVILILLGIVAFQLYTFYGERLGYTPTRAITDYFMALSGGQFDTVYRMTSPESFTDIYGRRITPGEFSDQLRDLVGDNPVPFSRVEVEKLFESGVYRYYEVTLHSSIGGRPGQSRVIVEIQRSGNTWLITYPFAIVL
jgi:hypothetical protein